MENDKKIKIEKGQGFGCAIAIFIVALIIMIPVIINTVKDNREYTQKLALENKLIHEGKVVSSQEIIEKFVAVIKNREQSNLDAYLSKDFTYIDNSSKNSKHIEYFWNDLKYSVAPHYIERRNNSIENEETYFIYWNIPEGIEKAEYLQYSLQRIFVYMRKVVKENEVTYEIYKVILKDN